MYLRQFTNLDDKNHRFEAWTVCLCLFDENQVNYCYGCYAINPIVLFIERSSANKQSTKRTHCSYSFAINIYDFPMMYKSAEWIKKLSPCISLSVFNHVWNTEF